MGTRGWSSNPDIPWCQRSGRSPPAMLWARTRRACLLTKLLGVLEATVLMGGLAGLVTGMYLLAPSPLPGVMVMLASMTLLLSSVAKLGQAQEGRQQSNAGRELSVRNRVSDCNSGEPGVLARRDGRDARRPIVGDSTGSTWTLSEDALNDGHRRHSTGEH